MSYSILYDKVFIKTRRGITPVVLMGDNNLTQIHYGAGNRRYERRCRSWQTFSNILDLPASELRNKFKSFCVGYNEHFKMNGKYVDDAGLMRMVEYGIKHAMTVEEVAAASPETRALRCYISVDLNPSDISHGSHQELLEFCKTTEELEDWIVRARARYEQVVAAKGWCYITLGFMRDEAVHISRKYATTNGAVVAKHIYGYVTKIEGGKTSFSENSAEAMAFASQEEAILQLHDYVLNKVRFVNAETILKKAAYKHIIRIVSGYNAGCYILKRVRGKLKLSYNEKMAMKFESAKAAERYIERLKPGFKVDFEVTELPTDEEAIA